jgi:O-antigen/teichoic acid export membrane protein
MVRRAPSDSSTVALDHKWPFAALLERLREGEVARALLRGSAVSLILNVAGQGLALLLQVLFARLLGLHEYGLWSYAMAWLGVAVIAGKLGFDFAFIRFLPTYRVRGERALFSGLVSFGRWVPALVSSMIGVAVAAAALLYGRLAGRDIDAAWLIVWLMLPVAVFSELSSIVLRSVQRTALSLLGDGVGRPIIAALLVLLAYGLLDREVTSGWAMGAYAAATACVCFVVALWVRRHTRAERDDTRKISVPREWLSTSLPLMMAGGFQILLYSVDTLMLGALQDTTAAGVYSVAGRVALVALFAMNCVQVIAGPMFAEALAKGRTADLQRLVTISIWLSAVVAVPLTLLLVTQGERVLAIFGADFTAGAGALSVLALAQLFNVATGPVGVLLSTSGHHNKLATYLAIGLGVNVALNMWLIPAYQLLGAAVSALVAHVLWNALAAWFVWRRLGINCTVFARLV